MSEIIQKMNKQKEDFDAKNILADDDRKRQTRETALSMSLGSLQGTGVNGVTIVARAAEFEKYLNGGL